MADMDRIDQTTAHRIPDYGDVLAIDPRELDKLLARNPARASYLSAGMGYGEDDEPKSERYYALTPAGVAVVKVEGVLFKTGGWFWDGHAMIRKRLMRAIADDKVRTIALLIDSPGGDCAGLFESVRSVRSSAKEHGKPIDAYLDEMGASAGYAWACAAESIALPESGCAGSVGVTSALRSRVGMNEQIGIDVELIASGRAKTYGHPDAEITDEAREDRRKMVDRTAGVFFGLVAEARGKSADEIRAQEARLFWGSDAVAAGLADAVMSREAFLQRAETKAKEIAMSKTGQALGLGANVSEAEVKAYIEAKEKEAAEARALVAESVDAMLAAAVAAKTIGEAEVPALREMGIAAPRALGSALKARASAAQTQREQQAKAEAAHKAQTEAEVGEQTVTGAPRAYTGPVYTPPGEGSKLTGSGPDAPRAQHAIGRLDGAAMTLTQISKAPADMQDALLDQFNAAHAADKVSVEGILSRPYTFKRQYQ